MIPPVVGPATVARSRGRAHSAIARHSRSVSTGRCSTWNFSRYVGECRPDASTKCPSRRAPDARKMRSTSAGVIGIATYSARMRAWTFIPKKPGSAEVREVPDPVPADDEVVIDVIRVGLCGTDAEIDRGEYGIAPSGSGFLILGHESVGRVTRRARAAGKGMGVVESTLVVASVRRPDGCPNCSRGEADMCLWGDYTERGIRGLHGFCAERYAERPEYLFPLPDEIAAVAVLLEPLSISEKGWRQVSAAQRRMTIWEPRRAIVTGAGPVGILAAVLLRLRGLDVTVVERTAKPDRRALLARIGVGYAATAVPPLDEGAGPQGHAAVILEATGSSEVAFAAMDLVGPNGALILTSVTGGAPSLRGPADRHHKPVVLSAATGP